MDTRIRRCGLLPLLITLVIMMSGTGPTFAQDPLMNLTACREGGFSTEEDFMMQGGEPFDGDPYISDGDLLSPGGQVCARNAELLRRFDIQVDLGLDGVDILGFEPGLVAFSTELDSPFGSFSAGDMLVTNGTIIPNSALVAAFGIPYDIGLDELKVVGKIEDILRFIEATTGVPAAGWQGDRLQSLLEEFNIDIWFSIEGTRWDPERPILDGDLLSALGSIVATNRDLLTPGAPAGLPTDGVDFGLDAFAVARDALGREREVPDLVYFSTELLYEGEAIFNDGDVLRQGGGVVISNDTLIAGFNPAAKFLGLDALYLPFDQPPGDPRITTVCDLSVSEFNGGIAPVGGAGTGLHESPLTSPPALMGTLTRPCGMAVPINGSLPVPPASVQRFRVVFREHSEAVPAIVGDPATSAIQTTWQLKRGQWLWIPLVGWQWVCTLPTPLSTDANGWMDAQAYIDAKSGTGSFVGCPNPELRLAVWDTLGLPAGTPTGDPIAGVRDREDHYVLWLEWEDSGGTMLRETVDHHVQLDNTLPIIALFPNGLQLRLSDGVTEVPACGEAPAGASVLQVWGQFVDRYYSHFTLGLKGGLPPTAVGYGPHNFYDPTDGTPGVKDTDDTGTVPDGITVRLRDIDMTDLGASFNKCCYLLEMLVYDRAIRHTFDGVFVNDFTGANYSYTFMTFSATP